MNDLFSLAVFVQAAIYVGIGFAVLSRNPKKSVNLSFFALCLLASVWIIASYFGGTIENRQLSMVLVHVDYFLGLPLICAFWLFAKSQEVEFGLRKKLLNPGTLLILAIAVIGSISTLFPSVLEVTQSGDEIVITEQPAYLFLYLLPASVLMVHSMYILWKLRLRGGHEAKSLVDIILLSFLAPALLVGIPFLLFDITIEESTELRFYQRIGTLGFTFFILATYYAVAKHKLFDMKRFFAQSTVYLLSLGAVSLIYGLSIFTLTEVVFPDNPLSSTQQFAYILIALVLAYTFKPLKDLFDKFTTAYFFHDSYNSQLILDKLSSLLATEIDLKVIVDQSSEILSGALKPLYIRFVVFKDGEVFIDHKQGEAKHKKLHRNELAEFSEVIALKGAAKGPQKRFFKRYDAEVVLKLKTNEETIGTVLLGPKQSGTVYSKQDIDLLTISEKELAIAVQNSRYFEQIQEFNVKLQREVSEATSELRASNTKLKELDEAKDEFISMASHQLRTPLTSVKGYISMVIEGDAGKIEPAQKKLLDEAFASSQRMVYLIADLLNVSRLRTGKFVIEPGEVYLPDIVREEVHQLEPTARSRKLKLVFDKPARFPKVWLDETKIRQVIMNFIDNAIYYTPAGGRIEIRLSAKQAGIEYSVKDNGIGVPRDEQAKLFTKFFRAGNAKQARPDGTGLGLYMAQRVVSAQGGTVIFQSQAGKGSTFGFFFPFRSVKTRQSLEKVARVKQSQSEPIES